MQEPDANDALSLRTNTLPDKPEELHRWILVGREKLNAHRAKIRAIQHIGAAHAAKDAALSDAQDLADALLDAEARLGELLAKIEPKYEPPTVGSTKGTHGNIPRQQPSLPPGIDKKTSHQAQTIASRPDVLEGVKLRARDEGRVATSRDAYRDIKSADRRERDAVAEKPWPAEDLAIKAELEAGKAVAVNMNRHHHAIAWAREAGLYVRVDRASPWGNPFVLDDDGDRDTVCESYERHYLPWKPSLTGRIDKLKGKALGCHCAPKRCHADTLASMANEGDE